jgi:hypothetical protein
MINVPFESFLLQKHQSRRCLGPKYESPLSHVRPAFVDLPHPHVTLEPRTFDLQGCVVRTLEVTLRREEYMILQVIFTIDKLIEI